MPKTAQEQIADIRAKAEAEIEKLQAEALAELEEKRKNALSVLRGIDDEITALTGKAPRAKRGSTSKPVGKTVTVKDLEGAIAPKGEEFSRAVAKSLKTTSAEVLATVRANPEKFKAIKNGPQPKVKRL